jgi:heme-degrading monooxygenase HmoA
MASVPYTLGIWRVKAGRGEEFIEAWTEFADWTAANIEGAGRGTLLRDLDDGHRFVSVGPWESLVAIQRWRQDPGWGERVSRIREMLEGFEPSTLELVVESDH